MLKIYPIELTLEELLLIDGKVSEKAQEVINKAKQESTYGFDLPIMNEILRNSEKLGSLTWRYKQIRSCSYCDKKYDYHEYPRNGRYHNKGDKNYNKPKYYSGIAFNEGFVTIQGYGDMCSECASKHNVIHRLIDYIIDNDLKVQIQKNDYRFTKYIKDDKSHKTTNKFAMIENPAFGSEILINEIKKEIEQYNKEKEKDIKIKVFEIYNKPNHFLIWTEGQNNRDNREVIGFNLESKIYSKKYGFKEQHQNLVNILEKYNYISKK